MTALLTAQSDLCAARSFLAGGVLLLILDFPRQFHLSVKRFNEPHTLNWSRSESCQRILFHAVAHFGGAHTQKINFGSERPLIPLG